MKHVLMLSWLRIRGGLCIAFPLLLLATTYLSPSSRPLDTNAWFPNVYFAAWLASRLFSGDDRSPEEAHVRSLPLDPGRVLLARALFGLGVMLAVFLLQLPFWYLGPLAWLRNGLFDIKTFFLPPCDLSLLLTFMFAAFGASAWFAKSLGYAGAAKGGHWAGMIAVIVIAMFPAWGGGALPVVILFTTGVFGILGATRCVRRREVWATADHQWLLGAPRRGDALFTAPAQLLLVVAPVTIVATRAAAYRLSIPGSESLLAPTVGVLVVAGVLSLPVAHIQARQRGAGLAQRALIYALALSGVGWALWYTLRRPHALGGPVSRLRLGHRHEASVVLFGALLLAMFALGHFVRPVQTWRVVVLADYLEKENAPLDATVLLDGECVGHRFAEGGRMLPVAGNPYFMKYKGNPVSVDLAGATAVETRALIEALDRRGYTGKLPPARELERSLPDARLEVRVGDKAVPLSSVMARTDIAWGRRSSVLTFTVGATAITDEVDAWLETVFPSDEDLARWASAGDAFWREVRRRMPPGQLARKNEAGEWDTLERLTESELERRAAKLARLDSLLARRYDLAGDDAEAFERIWADVETRRTQPEPLGRSHFCRGPREHFLYLEPQLRALALLEGAGRTQLDERLEAGDVHAALAAGLRGDPADAAVLEHHLATRRAMRKRIDGGFAWLEIDDRALIYGWALLAVDRERGTEVLRDALGAPDPLPLELLVINDGSAELVTELERWLAASDVTLARTWRLRDRHQVLDLRKRISRALYGTEHTVSPIDYFEQSPGFLALMPVERDGD